MDKWRDKEKAPTLNCVNIQRDNDSGKVPILSENLQGKKCIFNA